MKSLRTVLLSFLFVLICVGQSWAANRVALIIGMEKYQNLSALNNPARDADDIAKLLGENGFQVFLHKDLDHAALEAAVADFGRQTKGAEEAIIYYAGHGMSVVQNNQLQNVIAPIDASISCQNRTAKRVKAMDDVFEATIGIPKRIFLFDACRNDPFPNCPAATPNAARGYGFRPVQGEALEGKTGEKSDDPTRGFSRDGTKRYASSLVAFSTEAGALALDGEPGTNSPFAAALISELRSNKRMPIREVLDRTSKRVASLTSFGQVPWVVTKGGEPDMCLSGQECETGTALKLQRAIQQVQRITQLAKEKLNHNDHGTALLLALETKTHEFDNISGGFRSAADSIISVALRNLQERHIIETKSKIANYSWNDRHDILITGDERGLLTLWDSKTGLPSSAIQIRSRATENNQNNTMNFWGAKMSVHFDGKFIAVLSSKQTPRTGKLYSRDLFVWRLNKDGKIKKLAFQINDVGSFDWHPDGKLLAVTPHSKSSIEIFDLQTGTKIRTLHAQKKYQQRNKSVHENIIFSPNGNTAVTFNAPYLWIWNMKTGRIQYRKKLNNLNMGGVYYGELIFTPNSENFIMSYFNQIRIHRVRDGRLLKKYRHGNEHFEVFGLDVSADSRRVAAIDHRGKVGIWDVKKNKKIATLNNNQGPIKAIQFSKDGRKIIGFGEEGFVKQWDIRTTKIEETLAWAGGGRGILELSKNNDSYLVWNQEGGQIRAFEITRIKSITLRGPNKRLPIPTNSDFPDANNDSYFVISPFGKAIANIWQSVIRVYDFEKQSVIFQRPLFDTFGNRASVVWNYDGSGLRITKHNKHNYYCVRRSICGDASEFAVWRREFTPNTKKFGSRKKSVNLDTAKLERVGDNEPQPIGSFVRIGEHFVGAWNPPGGDGEIGGKSVIVWSATSGRRLHKLTGHYSGVRGFLESPSGKTILTISQNGTVRVWASKSGALISKLPPAANIAFGEDGTLIGVRTTARRISRERSDRQTKRVDDVHVWRIEGFDIEGIEKVVDAIPRCLTRTQRADFMLSPSPPHWCIEKSKWPYHTHEWKAWLEAKKSGQQVAMPAN